VPGNAKIWFKVKLVGEEMLEAVAEGRMLGQRTRERRRKEFQSWMNRVERNGPESEKSSIFTLSHSYLPLSVDCSMKIILLPTITLALLILYDLEFLHNCAWVYA
jgi:hypothetical protein